MKEYWGEGKQSQVEPWQRYDMGGKIRNCLFEDMVGSFNIPQPEARSDNRNLTTLIAR